MMTIKTRMKLVTKIRTTMTNDDGDNENKDKRNDDANTGNKDDDEIHDNCDEKIRTIMVAMNTRTIIMTTKN